MVSLVAEVQMLANSSFSQFTLLLSLCCQYFEKKLVFSKVDSWLQGGWASWLEWTFDWYSPKLGKAVDWLEAGLPFTRTLVHPAELGSQKPPGVQQWEVLCQAHGRKKPLSTSVDRRPAGQVVFPLKVILEVWGRQSHWVSSVLCILSTRKSVSWSGEEIIPLYTTLMRPCLGVVSNSAPTPKCQKAAASPVEEPLTKWGKWLSLEREG